MAAVDSDRKVTVPPSDRMVPDTARSVVVFPAPLAPSRATTSPAPTSSDTDLTTGTPS
jgi:hypothetical protein